MYQEFINHKLEINTDLIKYIQNHSNHNQYKNLDDIQSKQNGIENKNNSSSSNKGPTLETAKLIICDKILTSDETMTSEQKYSTQLCNTITLKRPLNSKTNTTTTQTNLFKANTRNILSCQSGNTYFHHCKTSHKSSKAAKPKSSEKFSFKSFESLETNYGKFDFRYNKEIEARRQATLHKPDEYQKLIKFSLLILSLVLIEFCGSQIFAQNVLFPSDSVRYGSLQNHQSHENANGQKVNFYLDQHKDEKRYVPALSSLSTAFDQNSDQTLHAAVPAFPNSPILPMQDYNNDNKQMIYDTLNSKQANEQLQKHFVPTPRQLAQTHQSMHYTKLLVPQSNPEQTATAHAQNTVLLLSTMPLRGANSNDQISIITNNKQPKGVNSLNSVGQNLSPRTTPRARFSNSLEPSDVRISYHPDFHLQSSQNALTVAGEKFYLASNFKNPQTRQSPPYSRSLQFSNFSWINRQGNTKNLNSISGTGNSASSSSGSNSGGSASAATMESVNFSTHGMDHLYLMTNFVLDYLLDNELPQQLINETLLVNPLPVLDDNRAALMQHFHKVLLAACIWLCIAISIPLFGFLIICCYCSSKSGPSNRNSLNYSQNFPNDSASSSSSHDDSPIVVGRSTRTKNSSRSSRPRSSHSRMTRSSSAVRSHSGVRSGAHDQFRGSGHGRHRHHSNTRSTSNGQRQRRSLVVDNVKYDRFFHPCIRTFLASHTFLVLLLVAFFVVCAFVTNENINSGIGQLPKSLNQSLDDIENYLNNTDFEVDNLLKGNFHQLEQELGLRLDSGGAIIKHKLAILTEASALTNLSDIVIELNDTKIRLEQLDKDIASLRQSVMLAKFALSDLEHKITTNCRHNSCPLLSRKYLDHPQTFKISANYERLPTVKVEIDKISLLLSQNIISKVQLGRDKFELLGQGIQSHVNDTVPDIRRQLNLVGRQLAEMSTEIGRTLKMPINDLEVAKSNTWRLAHLNHYEMYRHYFCLGASFIVLFILALYSLGWTYGSCKPQPTYRTRHAISRTSASASCPFTCGIVTVFIVFLPLMLAAIAFFIFGSIGEKIVCQVAKHPERNQSRQIFAMLQNRFLHTNISLNSPSPENSPVLMLVTSTESRPFLPTNSFAGSTGQALSNGQRYYRPNLADLIERCHRNQSIYHVLKLDLYDRIYLMNDKYYQGYNLSAITDFKRSQNVETKLKELLKRIDIDPSGVQLLSKPTEDLVHRMANISFDDLESAFSRLLDSGAPITVIDFAELSKDLITEIGNTDDSDIQIQLRLAAIESDTLNSKILSNITMSMANLREGIRHLRFKIAHGRSHSAYVPMINELINKVKHAEEMLSTNGKQLIKDVASEYVKEMNGLIDQYANHVQNQVENVIGRCEPISRAINSTSSAICDDIVQPFNGYWFSLISSLLLILIATFFVSSLKDLYKRAKRTPGEHHIHRHHHCHRRMSGDFGDQADLSAYEDEEEGVALAYLDHHHQQPPKASSSSMPSAPPIVDGDGWSPTAPSQHYVHASRPPPYVL